MIEAIMKEFEEYCKECIASPENTSCLQCMKGKIKPLIRKYAIQEQVRILTAMNGGIFSIDDRHERDKFMKAEIDKLNKQLSKTEGR